MPQGPYRRWVALAMPALIGLSACGRSDTPDVAGRTPDATVTMSKLQAAFIGSAGAGEGTLVFRGRSFPFIVAGGGIGGFGVSTIDAEGEVYNLRDVSQFPGAYGQARAGFAFGTRSSGQLWLQNTSGVVISVRASRRGLALSLGGDVVVITMRT